MKLSKAALSVAMFALFTCGSAFAQGSGSADRAKGSQTAQSQKGEEPKTSESTSASAGATAQTPLEQRTERDSERNWTWLGLLGLLGLAGFFRRRREPDTAHPGTGKRRVAIYDDK